MTVSLPARRPDPAELLSWLEDRLDTARRSRPRALALPVPPAPDQVTVSRARRLAGEFPSRLLDLDPDADAFLWLDERGEEWAGLGIAERLDASGPDRFRELRAGASALASRLEVDIHPLLVTTSETLRPRLFGGASFSASRGPGADAWEGFGDCSFVLPRLALTALDPGAPVGGLEGSSVLWVNLAADEDSDRVIAEVADLLAARCESERGQPRSFGDETAFDDRSPFAAGAARTAARSGQLPVSRSNREQGFLRQVEEIRSAIVSDRFQKVVAARCVDLSLPRDLDPRRLVQALEGRSSGCTRFLFRRGGRAFLGATPERLIRRQGRRVRTHALAGSIEPSGRNGSSADQLLSSHKDQLEHRLVVDHLVERLDPRCATLRWSESPVVRRLRDVLHLETPMEGELRDDLDVLELVARLHPTPAVGGVPTRAAERWIVAHEDCDRGWYSGPVGWFDLAGDGDFVVALRSLLVSQEGARAFVGAGIVADSDPEAELYETEVKLRTLRSAIAGVAAATRRSPRESGSGVAVTSRLSSVAGS